jgi:hypothetical protein
MKTTRIARLMPPPFQWHATLTRRHSLCHALFTGRNFTLSDRRSAAGAKVVENLFVRQD